MPLLYPPPLSRKRALPARLPAALFLLCLLAVPLLATARNPPANLGRGLFPLLRDFNARREAGRGEHESFQAALAASAHAQADRQDRVLVDVLLDGSVPLDQVSRRSERLGGAVTATISWYRNGLFSVWLPLGEADSLAGSKGVSAVHLVPVRQQSIGAATSQGVVVHHTDLVNNSGYLGAGVTVGLLSDSYNDDSSDAGDPGWTTAAMDVSTGDLPGVGNPNGYTTPVNVLEDGGSPSTDTDEGRAMLQIVHDVAPAANLAFCTAGNSDAEMAANIGRLQHSATCQVICDDTFFFDEPMFSDGVIAQAINSAAAAGVAYFSAIGNNGNSGYQAVFTPVANSLGSSQATAEGVNVSSIPRSEASVISQWHAFGAQSGGAPIVVQNITTGAALSTLVFQWDDPFDVVKSGTNGVTTDFDILVFNSNGNYNSLLSGVDNNISTNEPIEFPQSYMSASTSYKICIVLTTRRNGVEAPLATHLRYSIYNDFDVITGDYIQPNNVTAQGHAYAAGSAGVAAYNYDDAPDPGNSAHVYTPLVEGFSSNGPIDIYFDSAGNRLATPITRKQPLFACADNVDTTFFPPSSATSNPADYDHDGFPNFAGTSAATPHAAGIAALLINAAAVNNLGPLSPREIQSLMIATTQGIIDEDPLFCSGTAGPVTVTDSGDHVILPNVFEVAFSGTTGQTLTNVTINLTPVTMHFDLDSSSTANGEVWTQVSTSGTPAPINSSRNYSGTPAKSSMSMSFSDFNPGDTFSFSVGFDNNDTGKYGYNAEELGGATISAIVSGTTYTGTLRNNLGYNYNYKSGFGLLDAQAAINLLLSQ